MLCSCHTYVPISIHLSYFFESDAALLVIYLSKIDLAGDIFTLNIWYAVMTLIDLPLIYIGMKIVEFGVLIGLYLFARHKGISFDLKGWFRRRVA